MPTGLVIIGDVPAVPVTVVATANDLKSFDRRTLHASADFSKAKPGTDRIPVHVDNPNPNVQVDAPAFISVPVDEQASVTLPITIERVGALPPGFHEQTGTTTVIPATVRIDGPKSLLTGIQAIAPVQLPNLTSPIDQTYQVVVTDAKKRTLKSVVVTPPQVSVKMSIQADAVTETKPVGWTLIGQPAAGYRVTNVTLAPLQVNATGLLNTLAGVNLLLTDPVDMSGATTDVVRTINIRPPAGVEVSQKTVQIHVFVAKSAQVSPSPGP
ncbi:MAG: CdaR family protein [Candidatus Dormibacteraeota bacterium]|nr:CdaR family protein [Candidatus Dormibacteraeota bacterium]